MAMINYADKVALNSNSNIADINKVNATDMNDIKGAVNQIGSYNTAVAVTNGDFKVTLKGTLTTGDTVNIKFPNALNDASNARLSIDNGTTYKNIVYSNAVAAIGADISTKYIELYYNGTNWVTDIGEKVLYDNGTTGTYGAITLAETAANFVYAEIFFKNNDNEFTSCKIYAPDGKSITLVTNHKATSYMYVKAEQIGISGTALTRGGGGEARIGNSVATTYGTGDKVAICRIIGFRK